MKQRRFYHLLCGLIIGIVLSTPAYAQLNTIDVSVSSSGVGFSMNFGSLTLPTSASSISSPALWSQPENWSLGNDLIFISLDDSIDPSLNFTLQGVYVSSLWGQISAGLGPTQRAVGVSIPIAPAISITPTITFNYDVTIDGGRTVILDQNSTLNSLFVGTNSTLLWSGAQVLSVANGLNNQGTLNVQNQGALYLQGTNTNSGVFSLNSTGDSTQLVIQGQIYNYNYGTFSGGLGAQLTGGGTITLSDNPNNAIFGASAVDCEGLCYPNGPAAQLINQDNTIQGAGTIGYVTSPLSQRLDLINHGLVDANASNPLILNLATASANDGIMQASNGGTLIFGSGSIDNTGGTIQALNGNALQGSTVSLQGAQISHGVVQAANGGTVSLQYGGIDHATLQALDGGAVNFSGYGSVSSSTLTTVGSGTMQTLSGGNSTFTDVTISSGSVVRMNDNSYLTLSGQITNQGTIALNSTGNLTGLVIQGQIYNYNYGTFSGGLGANTAM